jgi:hypothetical protein
MTANNLLSVALPYCLERMVDGTYVVLNRKYKPIGFQTQEHVEYENFPVIHKIQGITKEIAENLSWNGSDTLGKIYLYVTNPTLSVREWKSYSEKLKILSKCKTK